MEMRKFIVELHTDGSMTWTEYTDPHSKEDRDYLCSKAMDSVARELDTTPLVTCSPGIKIAYLSGAASMAEKLRKVL